MNIHNVNNIFGINDNIDYALMQNEAGNLKVDENNKESADYGDNALHSWHDNDICQVASVKLLKKQMKAS
jgi:hypothetical protein